MSKSSVGVIGLGSMGLSMARNALAAGLAVKGYDVAEGARDALRKAGGTPVDSAAEAAGGVDAILVMVVNAAQAKEALFDSGAAAAAAPGTVCVVSSTVAPADARDIGGRLAGEGLLALDAPVSGGAVGAEEGTLTVMASGAPEAFRKARPLLEAVSGTVYELGDEPGMGSTYKVVHQLAAGVHLAVAAEVMALGANAGCDAATLFDILSKSAGRSWMMTDRVPHMLDEDYAPRSTVEIFVKDLGLVLDTGSETNTPLPLASAAHGLFMEAVSMGHGRMDDAAVVKVYESKTGSPVAGASRAKGPASGRTGGET